MSAPALKALAAASAAGVTVIPDGDGLILDPMPAADLVAELRAVKPELLRVLAGRLAARAIINTAEPPPDCSEQRWVVARRGLKRFLDEGWGDQSTLLGWTLEELYAVPPVWGRVDLCGAALLIADRRVVAITEATITTVGVTGSHLKFYRAPRARVVDVVAQDVKAEVVAEVVAEIVAEDAACMQISIQARLEPVRPEPAQPAWSEPTGIPFYEFFCGGGMARAGLGAEWSCTFANDISPMKIASYTRNWGRDGVKTADVGRLKASDLPGKPCSHGRRFPVRTFQKGAKARGCKGCAPIRCGPALRFCGAYGPRGARPG